MIRAKADATKRWASGTVEQVADAQADGPAEGGQEEQDVDADETQRAPLAEPPAPPHGLDDAEAVVDDELRREGEEAGFQVEEGGGG